MNGNFNISNIPSIPNVTFSSGSSDPFGGAIVGILENQNKMGSPSGQNSGSPFFQPTYSSPPPNVQSSDVVYGRNPYEAGYSVPPSSVPSSSDVVYNRNPFEMGYQISEPMFSSGAYSGKTYQTVVNENSALIQKHDRASPCPYVCGTRCNLDYNFTKWFSTTYRRELYLCSNCPWYVIAQVTRFPDNDPKYPGALFNDICVKDPAYFSELPDTGRYISLKGLYRRRMNRATGFPNTIKSKYAGKSFEEILMTTPDYFKWIEEKYSGRDDVYFDAVDWYSENKHRAPIIEKKQYTKYEPKVLSESAGLAEPNTLFETGKYRGKSFSAVYAFDPNYYDWLSTSYRGKSENMIAAIEWFRKQCV